MTNYLYFVTIYYPSFNLVHSTFAFKNESDAEAADKKFWEIGVVPEGGSTSTMMCEFVGDLDKIRDFVFALDVSPLSEDICVHWKAYDSMDKALEAAMALENVLECSNPHEIYDANITSYTFLTELG
jgi:hypothetical protein